ncbi:MAG: histone deacetylase family protein [Burkholderiaceae bacterium]
MPSRTAYIHHPSSLDHDMGPGHPERPARVEAIERALAAAGLTQRMTPLLAPKVTREQALRLHPEALLDLLIEASPDEGLAMLDSDTSMCPQTWDAIQHAAGAGVLAVEKVLSGEFDRAFCCVRPPGHHAERDRPMGFCFLGNVSIAARHATDALGLPRVAVIDFDVHHGNGTEDLLAGDDRFLMVGSFQHGIYPGWGETPRAPNIHNVGLPGGSDGRAVREACDKVWLPALREFAPQLLLISAGFDAHADDPLAGLEWHEDDYAYLTESLVSVAKEQGHGRVVSMLEGGYDLDALGRSTVAHVRALIG